MKKLLISIILLISSSNACAWGYGPFAQEPYDKASHAIAGMFVRKTIGDEHPILGAVVSGALGYAKEMTDQHFSKDDALAWLAGVRVEFKF